MPPRSTRIDNLEARTSNNEQDITALQQTTGTVPAEHVAVPVAAVVQPSPAQPAIAPAPMPSAVTPELAAVFVPYTTATL